MENRGSTKRLNKEPLILVQALKTLGAREVRDINRCVANVENKRKANYKRYRT